MCNKWIKHPQKVIPQLLVAVVGSWGYFCMGAVRGWSSPGIPSLNSTLDFEASETDFKWISSFPMIGAVLGALLVNKPMQFYGRKSALIGHYLIFITGFLITGFTYFAKHKALLYVGRFLMGFAAGCTTPASQIYVSECASPSIRGRLGSLTASSLALGVLVCYIIGAFVEWNVLSWVFGCLPVVFLLMTVFMPESPAWLLANGREQEARQSLQRLRGKHTDISDELERMKEHHDRLQAEQRTQVQTFNWDEFFSGPIFKPLGISLGLMMFQQTSGVNVIIFHTVYIFQTAGSTIDERYATMIVGAVQLIFTIAAGFLVDRYGRRVLFIVSAITSAVPLAAIGIFFHFQDEWGEKVASQSLGWLPLVALIVFFITYSGGLSNVPFIVMGEMFPLRYRPLLGAFSSSFNLFSLFIMVRFFPDMMNAMGKDGTFYFYTGCTLSSAVFVYFLLPETKGKTLEDMEQLFRSKKATEITSSTSTSNSEIQHMKVFGIRSTFTVMMDDISKESQESIHTISLNHFNE